MIRPLLITSSYLICLTAKPVLSRGRLVSDPLSGCINSISGSHRWFQQPDKNSVSKNSVHRPMEEPKRGTRRVPSLVGPVSLITGSLSVAISVSLSPLSITGSLIGLGNTVSPEHIQQESRAVDEHEQ